MTDQDRAPARADNQAIQSESEALAAALSEFGRQIRFPPGIPYQAAQARGKTFNATIGQVTDGHGAPLGFESMTDAVSGLSLADLNRAFLYSPIGGIPEVREAWRRWQRRRVGDTVPSSTPIVTVGLTHALAILADLFCDPGRAVAVAEPYWGNYRETFGTRRGARVLGAPAYQQGRYAPRAVVEALVDIPAGEPALAVVNTPSNPGGYMPTSDERAELVEALLSEAERRPLVVICDDAYAGLVYESGVPTASLFWDLIGRHDNLVPVKVDGATKELSFFGGRVGFLTFPFEPESDAAGALESKVMGLTRSTLGSPVALSQIVVLRALLEDDGAAAPRRFEELRARLERRYRTLLRALEPVDRRLLRPLPFNAGCFSLLQLGEAFTRSTPESTVDAGAIRRHLLDRHDTGLIAVGERHLRIAFCSVARDQIAELVRRIELGASELA